MGGVMYTNGNLEYGRDLLNQNYYKIENNSSSNKDDRNYLGREIITVAHRIYFVMLNHFTCRLLNTCTEHQFPGAS
jgi:hypothetical protein